MRRWLLAWMLVTLLPACSEPAGPEALVRANIMAMEEALAERSNGAFMDRLAASFSGGRAGDESLDREAAQRLLAAYFLRYRNIEVLVSQVDVNIDPYQSGLATSTARVALAGGERLLPDAAGFYTVEGQWQNFDGQWKLTRLSWR